MIHIPKRILNKLKLKREEDIKKEIEELKEARAISNTKKFKESLEVVNKIGKEIGEMREWAPYCSDPKTYMPFPIDILKLTQQQMLQLLIHAYGTADHLSRELKSLQNMIKDHQEHVEDDWTPPTIEDTMNLVKEQEMEKNGEPEFSRRRKTNNSRGNKNIRL